MCTAAAGRRTARSRSGSTSAASPARSGGCAPTAGGICTPVTHHGDEERTMVTERLDEFLSGYCHPEEDPERVTAMLHGPSRGAFTWLHDDLADAIRSGD